MLRPDAHRILFALVATFLLGGCAVGPGSYTETIDGTGVEFDMVWIAEGAFWIGRTEVTWDEFLSYAGFDLDEPLPPGVDAVARPSKPLETTPYDRDWGKGRRPAVGLSRNAAEQYCRWLSMHTGRAYRLPTEAEWVLACGGADPDAIDAQAWTADNSDGMTHEVGSKAPNARGVHDMLGNLWEYCSDAYSADEPQRAVLRGGAWNTPADEVSPAARIGFERFWVLADPQVPPGVWWVPEGEHLGFRVVCARE